MYPVTQDFLDKMKADRRQVLARVAIDYTDPFIDQSIRIEASEQANVSYPQQTADSVDQATRKYACLDGTWDLTLGEYHLAPSADQLAQRQFGWWGAQFCDQDGYFASPYPTLTVRHLPRPMRQLKVVGDTARGEHPVDFTVKLYGPDDALLHTETVTGNDQVSWQKVLEPQVPDVAKQVLEITKWSLPGTCAKIIEFFTSIREVYETGDLVSLRLLEEREASQGSLPVGNISSNEITLALSNADKKFDIDNENSPLKNLLKPNRRIHAWLGLKGGGEGMDIQRNVDFSQGELNNLVVVNNKLQLPDVGSPSFSRNSVAYLSDGTQVAANQPRFEQGKFGEAIMVEEGTRNYIADSDGDGNPDGWHCTWNRRGVPPAVKEFITVPGIPGNVLHIQDTSAATQSGGCQTWEGYTSLNQDISEKTYTLSFWVKGTYTGCNRGAHINWRDSTNNILSQITLPWNVTSDWQRIVNTVTAPSGAYRVYIAIYLVDALDTGDSYDVYCGGLQFEEKSYATSWAGLGATRSTETLAIPWEYNGESFCWEGYICPGQSRNQLDSWIPLINASKGSDYIEIGYRGDRDSKSFHAVFWQNGNWKESSSTAVDFTQNDWLFVALTSDGVSAKFGIAKVGEPIQFKTFTLTTLNSGSYVIRLNHFAIGTWEFDDLRISNRARTDEEILAAYQSGQPLPVDEWTTYKLGFDGSLNFGQGGYYISPEYDLSAVGTAATSAITWQEDADEVQRTVYAKLDNQSNWTQVQNGGKLPISTGSVLTGRKLQIKTKLIKV